VSGLPPRAPAEPDALDANAAAPAGPAEQVGLLDRQQNALTWGRAAAGAGGTRGGRRRGRTSSAPAGPRRRRPPDTRGSCSPAFRAPGLIAANTDPYSKSAPPARPPPPTSRGRRRPTGRRSSARAAPAWPRAAEARHVTAIGAKHIHATLHLTQNQSLLGTLLSGGRRQ